MPSHELPNLALRGGYAENEDGWGAEMNANLLRLSVLTQAGVIGRVAALPAAPAEGDVYILTTDNTVQVYDTAAWTAYTPKEGWSVYDRGTDKRLEFVGGAWAEVASGGDNGGGGEAPADYASSTSFRFVIASAENYGQAFTGFGEVKLLDAAGAVLSQPIQQATASSVYDNNWPASEAFDNNVGSDNGWLAQSGKNLGEFLTAVFPAAIRPAKFQVFAVSNFLASLPKQIRVEYLDGAEWKPIATFDTTNPAAGVGQTFDLPKVAGGGDSGGSGGGLEEAPADGKLYGRKDKAWAEIVAGSGGGGGGGGGGSGTGDATSWAAGDFDRTSIYTITKSGNVNGNPQDWLISDRNRGDVYFQGGAPAEMVVDCKQPILIQGWSLSQDGNQENGLWTIAGSNDGVTWTDIITDYKLGGTAYLDGLQLPNERFRYSRTFANSTRYRYYRMKLNANSNTSSGPYVRQLIMKQEIGAAGGGGGGTERKRPTVVQKAAIRGDGRIELPNQPTPGNKLYFLAAGYGASDTSYPPAGFARAGRHISNNNNSVTLDILATITAATPKGFDVSAGDNQQAVLYEIADSEWAYPGLGGSIVYNGNNIFDLVNAPCPYTDDALVLLGLENDNTTRFAMPVQDKVTEDFNSPADGLNHTGWLGRVDRPGDPLIVKGVVAGAAQDAVFGFFWVIGPEVASAGGGGGGSALPWLKTPKAADFKRASGDPTNLVLADDADLGLLFDGGLAPQSDVLRYAYIDIPDPAKSWSCEIKIDVESLRINYNGYGIGVFSTAANRMVQLKQDEGGLRRARWVGLTAYEGNDATHLMYTFSGFLRIEFDAAANLYRYFISRNGKQWTPVGTSAAMVADRVGFFAHNNTQLAGYKVQGAVSHWSFTQ